MQNPTTLRSLCLLVAAACFLVRSFTSFKRPELQSFGLFWLAVAFLV